MIRTATHEDAQAIAELIGLFVGSLSVYDAAPFNMADATQHAQEFMAGDGSFGFVQVEDEKVIGFISGMTQPCPWNFDIIFGLQYAYFVHPEHRNKNSLRLLQVFENHCQMQGATLISSGAKNNNDLPMMDKMLTRKGYIQFETQYIKGV